MKKITVLKSLAFPLSTVIASSAFADVAADIAAAQTAGVSNVTLAVGAVIAIAAVALGIGLIRSLLSR